MVLPLLAGLVRLPMRPLSRDHRVRLLLDAGTVTAAAGLAPGRTAYQMAPHSRWVAGAGGPPDIAGADRMGPPA
jgi:hypothetical protein